jgi:hypothetical protein
MKEYGMRRADSQVGDNRPFHLHCVAKRDGLLDKLRGMHIGTEFDRDVFFFLLQQIYRISWPSGRG